MCVITVTFYLFQYSLVSEVRQLIPPIDLDVFDSLLTGREFEEVSVRVCARACVCEYGWVRAHL